MKQLILLLDGTWNDADFGPQDSNIVRMRDIINRSLDQNSDLHSPDAIPHAASALTSSRSFQGAGVEHLVFYERGVGTGPLFDVMGGAAFGDGLDDNIRRAYKFLSFHYAPGDLIFIFGFSRGAYTARSLAGYIHDAGLLKRDFCTPELEDKAWTYYRAGTNDRLPGTWTELTPYVADRSQLTIECVGVFDTVGALGIPLKMFWRTNRQRYEFHDVDLNPIVRINLQALAIDEHRAPFQATPWRQMPFKHYKGMVEQVWFAGCHSNIGGSGISEASRASQSPQALDDLALDWMLKRVSFLCPTFPLDLQKTWKTVNSAWSLAPLHEARTWPWQIFKYCHRAIANQPPKVSAWDFEVCGNFDRHAVPLAEMVHVSVIERLGCEALADDDGNAYRPRNLMAVFDIICATYELDRGMSPPKVNILIVDWTGHNLAPRKDTERQRAAELLLAARQRLDRLDRQPRQDAAETAR